MSNDALRRSWEQTREYAAMSEEERAKVVHTVIALEMPMRERMARAMYDEDERMLTEMDAQVSRINWDECADRYRRRVGAVLAALSEPTKAMVAATHYDTDIQGPVYLRGKAAWDAMIAAAKDGK